MRKVFTFLYNRSFTQPSAGRMFDIQAGRRWNVLQKPQRFLSTEGNFYLKKEVSKFKIACNFKHLQSYEIKDLILKKLHQSLF